MTYFSPGSVKIAVVMESLVQDLVIWFSPVLDDPEKMSANYDTRSSVLKVKRT